MHMEMPTVQDQHRKLQALAGSWTGEETMHPSPWDPKGGPATSRTESRIDLDGFHLITDYVQHRGGQVSYRGHGIFGWDPAEKCYTHHWFDSMGSGCPTPARGTWKDKTLTFESRHPMGFSRYIYVLESDGKYTFRIDNSQDGKQWATFMEGKYTRK